MAGAALVPAPFRTEANMLKDDNDQRISRLVLSLNQGESVVLTGGARIVFEKYRGRRIRLVVEAPGTTVVIREGSQPKEKHDE